MKAKFLKAFILLVAFFSIAAFRFQDDPFDLLLKRFVAFSDANPHEKVYLHLDKPYYAIGDDIWFKAYVTNNNTHQPSLISDALYVELIDESDSLKKQLKMPLVSGLAWGEFKLLDTLQEGNYRIRAYTQWMRNAGPDYFYDKTIKIGNSWANKVFTKTSYSNTLKNNKAYIEAKISFADKAGYVYAKRVCYIT